jgi:hypothetical protein
MGIIDTLFGGGIKGVGDAVKEVVGSFKLSPQARAELDAQLEEHKMDLAKMDMDLEGKLQDIAGQNVRSETGSDDKFTSRARPSFMYLVMVILFCNYVVFPLLKRPLIELPAALFWLFGSAILGYTGARSLDKMMGLPGDSQVQLPFGVKLGNKS